MASSIRKAVIDRIEDGEWAVLLVGRKQTERIIPVEQLPEGAGEGSWLRVRIQDDAVTEIMLDTEETEKVLRRVRSKRDALRMRRSRLQRIAPDEESSNSDRNEDGQESASKDDANEAGTGDADID